MTCDNFVSMRMNLNILIVDDQAKHNSSLSRLLSYRGYNPYSALNGNSAFDILNNKRIDIVLLDVMLGNESGMDILNIIKTNYPDIPVIMITAYGTITSAVAALQNGAADYIQKPISIVHLADLISKYCANKPEKEQEDILIYSSDIITKNGSMLDILEQASLYAPTDLPALIYGESGTGKELFADFIHQNSPRSEKPIQKINCSAFPASLLDNELFGHDKGAFTGADKEYKGIFERSQGSTLFLDEIGDMSKPLQAKILRTIQNKEIRRIGGKDSIHINVRFVAATNKDLYTLVQQNKFREDLFYRLNTAIFTIPPLRERKEDIPLLVTHAINNFNDKYSRQIEADDVVLNRYIEYDWPGNIRELINTTLYLCAMTKNDKLSVDALNNFLDSDSRNKVQTIKIEGSSSEAIEKEKITAALEKYNYNKIDTAKVLRMSRATLYRKIEKYSIPLKRGDREEREYDIP